MRSWFWVVAMVCAAVFGAQIFAGGNGILSGANKAYAAVPEIINYQGMLENASGTALGGAAGQSYDFKFSIWDSASGGTKLWPSSAPASTTLTVTNGVFNVGLGDTNVGFPALDLDFNSATPYYLQIEVYNATSSAFETLSPRQPIDAVGFAINSSLLNGYSQGTSSNDLLLLDGSGNINLPSGQIRPINSASCSGLTAVGAGALCYDTTSNELFSFNNASSSWDAVGGFVNPGYVTAASSVVWTALQTLNDGLTVNSTATFNSSTIMNGPAFFANVTSSNFDATGTLTVGGLSFLSSTTINGTILFGTAPPASATSSLLQLGSNPLAGGNAAGTYLGANSTSSADFINFQNNSTTVFQVTNTSTANVDLYIGPNNLVTTNASGTTIAENQSSPFNGNFINFEVNSSTVFGVDGTGKVTGVGGFSGQCLSSGVFDSSTGASCNMDVAESYPTYEPTSAGDVVAVPASPTQALDGATTVVEIGKSRGTPGETVLGVVSTNPGLVFDNGNTLLAGNNGDLITATKTIVALAGRVPVNVSNENGPIEPGDLLAASTDEPGYAARAVAPGMVIGTALQAFDGSATGATGTPQILVFVNPHWALGNLTIESDIASSGWAVPPSSGASSTPSVLDQFTLYIKYALEKLGVVISNGVATLDHLVANKVSTNELCVGGTCVNSGQFQQLLQQNGIQGVPDTSDVPDAQSNNVSSTPSSGATSTSTATSTLTVTVNVNNLQGGTATPSSFTLTMIAGHPSQSSFAGSASGTVITLDAATAYYTNISTLPNYTAGYNASGDCNDKNGALAGAMVSCTITETYVPAVPSTSIGAATTTITTSTATLSASSTAPSTPTSTPTSTSSSTNS